MMNHKQQNDKEPTKGDIRKDETTMANQMYDGSQWVTFSENRYSVEIIDRFNKIITKTISDDFKKLLKIAKAAAYKEGLEHGFIEGGKLKVDELGIQITDFAFKRGYCQGYEKALTDIRNASQDLIVKLLREGPPVHKEEQRNGD